MAFQLIDRGWQQVMDDALKAHRSELRIVCPFIKRAATERLLRQAKPNAIRVLTRFNVCDFYAGVSDTSALRLLMENGAQIRGTRNLHAKLYLFDATRAIVTSANLSTKAFNSNHEFGFASDDPAILATCRQYFDDLWTRAGPDLTAARLAKFEAKVTLAQAAGSRPTPPPELGDEGADAGVPPTPPDTPSIVGEATQWFVKFFGVSSKRVERSMSVITEVDRSGCHWACTYPKGKRPKQVEDGAVLFMARMMKDPPDMLIYGRAIGMRYVNGRDDATDADITLRPWKTDWPHYVRVHHPEFLAGNLSNGLSLNELMDQLESNAFASTLRNLAQGKGNTDPRKAYLQQAAVELTPEGFSWVNERLERAFAQHGKLTPADMAHLDRPEVPESAT